MEDYNLNFYVYVHRKKITGEIFYVGKGCNDRAWQTKSRSEFWFNIVNKYGLVVEIVLDGLQEWYAHELEMDLIALYGRRDLNNGTLVNLTDGGDGFAGLVYTDEMRKRVSIRVSGENHPLYNDNVFTFKNYKTGEVYHGTRFNFLKEHPDISGSEVTTDGNSKLFKGWYIEELIDPSIVLAAINGHKGIYNWNSKKTVYCFVNLKTNEKFYGTRVEFEAKYSIKCSNLFLKALRVGDWTLEDRLETHTCESLLNNSAGILNGRADKTVYSFYNSETGDVVDSTRVEFTEKYGVNVGRLFGKRKRNSIKGWSLQITMTCNNTTNMLK